MYIYTYIYIHTHQPMHKRETYICIYDNNDTIIIAPAVVDRRDAKGVFADRV